MIASVCHKYALKSSHLTVSFTCIYSPRRFGRSPFILQRIACRTHWRLVATTMPMGMWMFMSIATSTTCCGFASIPAVLLLCHFIQVELESREGVLLFLLYLLLLLLMMMLMVLKVGRNSCVNIMGYYSTYIRIHTSTPAHPHTRTQPHAHIFA